MDTQQNQMPQKIETDTQRLITPSGTVVELREVLITSFINGSIIKKKLFEVEPPMADACTPEVISDIRECAVCLGLFHKSNIQQCAVCGQFHCKGCKGEEKDNAGGVLSPSECFICTRERSMTSFERLNRKFWNI